jgi:5-methyltetrahydropteroyltriglutamate--homocysteine methyltransferase
MMRSESRIVTTHTGSLPRPEDLEAMILAREAGEPIDPAQLEARIRSGVEEIVGQQVAAGVDWINDGEASKASYMTYMTDRLAGYETVRGMEENLAFFGRDEFPGLAERLAETAAPSFAAVRRPDVCTGPISYIGSEAVQRDIDNLEAAVGGASVEGLFMPSISPGMLFTYRNEHYGSDEEYHLAIAEALREEYEAINRAGIVLQLDCPDFPGVAMAGGGAGRAELERRIDAINHAVANIPAEMAQIHLCWGNLQVPHEHDVGLREFVDLVLDRAKPAGLSIEASNPRHAHEWKVFEDVKLPDGKYLIPGVVDVKTNIVEHPDLVALRIVQYANLVGRENVVAGTDCGFASIVSLHTVLPAIAWEKLRAMREGADLATRQLW